MNSSFFWMIKHFFNLFALCSSIGFAEALSSDWRDFFPRIRLTAEGNFRGIDCLDDPLKFETKDGKFSSSEQLQRLSRELISSMKKYYKNSTISERACLVSGQIEKDSLLILEFVADGCSGNECPGEECQSLMEFKITKNFKIQSTNTKVFSEFSCRP